MDRESSLTDCPLIACLTGMWLQEFIVVSCNPPLQPPTLPRMNSPLSILTHDSSAKAKAKAGWSCSHSPSLQSYGLDEIRTHDPRASSTTLYQLSHQAISHIENTKFQYVENRLSILYFNNMNYYYIWRILLIQLPTNVLNLTIHCSLIIVIKTKPKDQASTVSEILQKTIL